MEMVAAALFAVALVHTFAAKQFERLSHRYPRHAGLFHLLGEVEVVFGFWAIVLVLAMALITILLLQWFLVGTRTGRQMQATAQNPTVARILGVPVERMILYTFLINAGLAAMASLLISPIFKPPLPVLFVSPGPDAIWYLAGFAIARSFVAGADMIVPRALMADAVDYGILKTGANPAGSYFALSSLAVSICAAVSSGVAFWLLDGFGVDPKPGAANADAAINGLIFTSVVLPTVFNITAALLIWRFPIDARRSHIIRRRIETRPANLAASQSV